MREINYISYLLVAGLLAVMPARSQMSSAPGASGSASQTSPSSGAQSSSGSQASSPYSSSALSQKVNGTVLSVDALSNSLTLRTAEGQEKKFTATTGTKFNLSHAGASIADVKAGQQVSVTANGSQAMMVEEWRGANLGSTASSSSSSPYGASTSGTPSSGAPSLSTATQGGSGMSSSGTPDRSAAASGSSSAAGASVAMSPSSQGSPSSESASAGTAPTQGSPSASSAGQYGSSSSSSSMQAQRIYGSVVSVDQKANTATIRTADISKFKQGAQVTAMLTDSSSSDVQGLGSRSPSDSAGSSASSSSSAAPKQFSGTIVSVDDSASTFTFRTSNVADLKAGDQVTFMMTSSGASIDGYSGVFRSASLAVAEQGSSSGQTDPYGSSRSTSPPSQGSSPSQAGSPSTGSSSLGQYGSAPPAKMSEQFFTGTVSEVDKGKMHFKIKTSDGQEKQFTTDTSTKFAGKWTGIADLKKGDHVTVMANGTKAMSVEAGATSGTSPTTGSDAGSKTAPKAGSGY